MKIKLLILVSILCGASLASAMDEPPPYCTTDKQKAEYGELQAALLSADTRRIQERVAQYGFDLNTPCMNVWSSRVHHPTYPIEWLIQKTYSHECIAALLKLGVPAQGYDDYSPLQDLLLRPGMNDIECIRVLYNAGADPRECVRARDQKLYFPLAYVRTCKVRIKNTMYKSEQEKLQHLNDIETILCSVRPADTPELATPGTAATPTAGIAAPQPLGARGPQQHKKTFVTPTRAIVAAGVCALAVFGIKKLYDKYYLSDDDTDQDDARDADDANRVAENSVEVLN